MRIAIASVLSAAALSHALVGDWTSYTQIKAVRDLEASKGNLFAATPGGIRKIDAKGQEKDYRNTEGLRDVGINALATSPEGDVFAASDLGYLYRYRPGSDDWEILTTSYRSAAWKMNKRAFLYRAGYLVLGSEKGLSFFNVAKRVADANVTKMEGANALSVNSVLFVGDTLFAGTNHGIFKALLHMDKLLTDPQVNVFNPGIWSRVAGTDGAFFFDPAAPKDDTAYTRDSLQDNNDIVGNKPALVDDASLYSHGFLYYGPSGIASEYEGDSWPDRGARVSKWGGIVMDGKIVDESHRLETICFVAGKWYAGALNDLVEFDPGSLVYREVKSRENLPDLAFTAIRANRSGIYALATPGVYRLEGREWNRVEGFNIQNDYNDSKLRGQHAFDVLGGGQFYVGTWGYGFQTFRDGKSQAFDAGNSCVASAVEGNYPVVWSQAQYKKGQGLWMGFFVVDKPYHVGYYDASKGTMTCFEPDARGFEPRNVQVVGDSILTVVTERGLEAFRISDGGGSISLEAANLLGNLTDPAEPLLAGKMDLAGNFWATTKGSQLLYVPSISFDSRAIQSFRSLDGFTGSSCMNLEGDPQGHLWAGCTEGGVFEIIPGKDTLSHTFRKYGLNDGLLSETIFNLEVNQDNGDIWVATEMGVARYESASRPVKPNLSTIKVYPNPFLAKHSQVVFDNLSSGSEVSVTTQSGSVVYHRSLAAGSGDQILWDGRNQAGQRVREGVYFWIVRSPKETKNGKIIVAR